MQDFGITPGEYYLYCGHNPDPPRVFWLPIYLVVVVACFLWIYLPERDFTEALLFVLVWHIPPFCLAPLLPMGVMFMLVKVPFGNYKRFRLKGKGVTARIEKYDATLTAYNTAKREAKRAIREAEIARRHRAWVRQEAERERRRKQAEYWMNLSSEEFEREVATLLQRRGYQGPTDGQVRGWRDRYSCERRSQVPHYSVQEISEASRTVCGQRAIWQPC